MRSRKKHCVIIKYFNRFMYDHSLHRGRKRFCHYCLHALITEDVLKHFIKNCFKTNVKQTIKMSKEGEYFKFKNLQRKIKSPFMIYVDFESILVPKDDGKQNRNESYISKYQKHPACSYGYKFVCVDDKFSKPFKSYLGKDDFYNFISSIIEESKYCSDVMKNHFNKELMMIKKDKEDFENPINYWACDDDVKVRDHCLINGRKSGSADRDCNVNVKLNHKIPVVFYNLKNCDSHHVMQVPGKLSLKIIVIANGLERYTSFSINNNLVSMIPPISKFFIR